MAELLVLLRDAAAAVEAPKRGDVAAVMPDGHKWGALEGPPRFVVLRVPGAAVSDFSHLQEPDMGALNPMGEHILNAYRTRGIDFSVLPISVAAGNAPLSHTSLAAAVRERTFMSPR